MRCIRSVMTAPSMSLLHRQSKNMATKKATGACCSVTMTAMAIDHFNQLTMAGNTILDC